MMTVHAHLHANLIAQHPSRIRDGVQRYGIAVTTLLLQEGPDLLPVLQPPLMIDLRGYTLSMVARLLVEMQRVQRHSGLIPHLLVAAETIGAQRLIAELPTLRAVVLDAADSSTIVRWLQAPLQLLSAQTWITIPQPGPSNRHSALTTLLAALDGAESIAIAAQRCAISEGQRIVSCGQFVVNEASGERQGSGWQP